MLAVPEATLPRGADTIAQVLTVADEWGAVVIYVGLPITLAGTRGPAAEHAHAFAVDLASAFSGETRLVDERLSTVEAQRALRDAGRSSRTSRSVIDQAAAVVILEQALMVERASGTLAGVAVNVVTGDGEGARP